MKSTKTPYWSECESIWSHTISFGEYNWLCHNDKIPADIAFNVYWFRSMMNDLYYRTHILDTPWYKIRSSLLSRYGVRDRHSISTIKCLLKDTSTNLLEVPPPKKLIGLSEAQLTQWSNVPRLKRRPFRPEEPTITVSKYDVTPIGTSQLIRLCEPFDIESGLIKIGMSGIRSYSEETPFTYDDYDHLMTSRKPNEKVVCSWSIPVELIWDQSSPKSAPLYCSFSAGLHQAEHLVGLDQGDLFYNECSIIDGDWDFSKCQRISQSEIFSEILHNN